jgi:hypothetical protein
MLFKNENYMRKITGGCNGTCMWCDGVGRGVRGVGCLLWEEGYMLCGCGGICTIHRRIFFKRIVKNGDAPRVGWGRIVDKSNGI